MPQPQIFIRAVLMIVVIHNRYANPRQTKVFENIHWHAAAQRWSDDRTSARRILYQLNERF